MPEPLAHGTPPHPRWNGVPGGPPQARSTAASPGTPAWPPTSLSAAALLHSLQLLHSSIRCSRTTAMPNFSASAPPVTFGCPVQPEHGRPHASDLQGPPESLQGQRPPGDLQTPLDAPARSPANRSPTGAPAGPLQGHRLPGALQVRKQSPCKVAGLPVTLDGALQSPNKVTAHPATSRRPSGPGKATGFPVTSAPGA